MIERIKNQMMHRIYTKQKESEEWPNDICPKIKKKVDRNSEFANTCYVLPAGMGVFQVTDRDKQCIVDIRLKCCDCRRWQLTGISCSHAISCLRYERIKPEEMVSFCYTIQAYKQAYGFNIMPVRDKVHWEKTNGVEVKPPLYEKKVGRPKKTRRKQPQELEGGTKISKHGVQIHCRYCRGEDHNIRGCKKRKTELNGDKLPVRRARTSPHGKEPYFAQVIYDIIIANK